MGYRLRELRKERHMTQEELSQKSGISRVTIYLIEKGRTENVMASTLLKLAEALGVSVENFFTCNA